MAASVIALLAPVAAMLLGAPHLSAASCFHGMRLAARAEAGPDYSYTGERGPLNWHGLSSAYKLCARGRNQSPINVEPGSTGITTLGSAAQRPSLNYPSVQSAQLKNLGSTIQVNVDGTLTFDGATWALKQFHFHTPSEHRLLDEHHPVEAHLVHERVGTVSSGASKIAVIGIPLDFTGAASSGAEPFETVLNKAPDVAAVGASTPTGPLDFSAVVAHVQGNVVYKYAGSLTTPPCDEGVTWLVSGVPMSLSVGAYGKAKKVMKFNSRYTQNRPGAENLIAVAARNYCSVGLCIA